MHLRRVICALALSGLALTVIGVTSRPAQARETRIDIYLNADMRLRTFRQLPALQHEEASTALRVISAGELPAQRGGLVALGAAGDLGFTVDDRFVIPTFGIGISAGLGARDRVLTSADGSIVELRPWTTVAVEVLLPGVGVRFKERRWMFMADARFAVSYLEVGSRLSQGTEWVDFSTTRTQLAVRGELVACRRIDPVERACISVQPHLYEFTWMNGATVALRWELGQ